MKAQFYFIFLVIILISLIPAVNANSYYTIPVQALSNSPADTVWNYFGFTSTVPSTSPGQYVIYVPTNGTIERVEIYDYSNGVAGSNQAYRYFVKINNATEYLIANLSVNTNERIFTNSSMNIPVTTGDTLEIARKHPVWSPNPTVNSVGGYILINNTGQGYTLPVQALTQTPADNVWNYYSILPMATSTTSAISKLYIPASGIITKVMINDYSGTAGTNEEINLSILKNTGNPLLIEALSVSQNQRIFDNVNLGLPVGRGDYVEIRRGHPNWTTNPATNRPAGNVYVDTSTITNEAPGYPIYVQALTSTPADSVTTYFGNRPTAPNLTAGRNKVYIPKSGNITRVELYQYSGTAGSQQAWSYYVLVNGATGYHIATQENVNKERFFKNLSMNVPIVAGDYIEIKSVQPNFGTNPATTITAGYLWIETGSTQTGCPPGEDIILPPFADFSANRTLANKPATIQFFDQSNNTIPGTTQYFWNFTNGGTAVDSTDINPEFIYLTSGEFTINHTISSGGHTSTRLKTVTITGADGISTPNASFELVLTDTSTQYPTIWLWNVTNLLGNNTEVTYSTVQNPILDLSTGNWRINFTATNAFGSDTTSQIIGINLSSPRVYFWNRVS